MSEKTHLEYPVEFKDSAVKRIREGQLIEEVVLELGIEKRKLINWIKEADEAKLKTIGIRNESSNNQSMPNSTNSGTSNSTSTKRIRKPKPVTEEDHCRTIPGRIGEKQENLSLEDTIEFINNSLEETFNNFMSFTRLKAALDNWLPNGSYSDFKQRFIEKIDNGQINNETIQDWWHDCMFRTCADADIGMLWSTFTFTILAQRALQHDERNEAWALAARASYYCGLSASSVNYEYFKQNDKQWLETRRNAHNNGDKYKNAIEFVVKILNNPPPGGWEDKLRTRKVIEPQLDKFLEKDFAEKRSSNKHSKAKIISAKASNLLRKWFEEDEKIRAAYYTHRSETLADSE